MGQPTPVIQFIKTWSFLILKSCIYRFLATRYIFFFFAGTLLTNGQFFFFEKAVRAQDLMKTLEPLITAKWKPKVMSLWEKACVQLWGTDNGIMPSFLVFSVKFSLNCSLVIILIEGILSQSWGCWKWFRAA